MSNDTNLNITHTPVTPFNINNPKLIIDFDHITTDIRRISLLGNNEGNPTSLTTNYGTNNNNTKAQKLASANFVAIGAKDLNQNLNSDFNKLKEYSNSEAYLDRSTLSPYDTIQSQSENSFFNSFFSTTSDNNNNNSDSTLTNRQKKSSISLSTPGRGSSTGELSFGGYTFGPTIGGYNTQHSMSKSPVDSESNSNCTVKKKVQNSVSVSQQYYYGNSDNTNTINTQNVNDEVYSSDFEPENNTETVTDNTNQHNHTNNFPITHCGSKGIKISRSHKSSHHNPVIQQAMDWRDHLLQEQRLKLKEESEKILKQETEDRELLKEVELVKGEEVVCDDWVVVGGIES